MSGLGEYAAASLVSCERVLLLVVVVFVRVRQKQCAMLPQAHPPTTTSHHLKNKTHIGHLQRAGLLRGRRLGGAAEGGDRQVLRLDRLQGGVGRHIQRDALAAVVLLFLCVCV